TLVGLGVDGQDAAVHRHAGKQPAIARVRIHLGGEVLIGRGGGLATYRTRGYRGVGAQCELAVGDALDALGGGEYQHDVGGLHADLPADVAARQRHHDGIGELAVGVPDHHRAAAASATDHRGNLDDVGDHG